ncbi:MAG: hypothetical protein KJ799_18240, partial [Bacteroidetes bacterium]|nr:hypothetical protein [Bacteroidota bacterium]
MKNHFYSIFYKVFFLLVLCSINVNIFAQSQSDLVFQNSVTVNPTSGQTGSNATVSFTIKNQGSGTANSSKTNIRISSS